MGTYEIHDVTVSNVSMRRDTDQRNDGAAVVVGFNQHDITADQMTGITVSNVATRGDRKGVRVRNPVRKLAISNVTAKNAESVNIEARVENGVFSGLTADSGQGTALSVHPSGELVGTVADELSKTTGYGVYIGGTLANSRIESLCTQGTAYGIQIDGATITSSTLGDIQHDTTTSDVTTVDIRNSASTTGLDVDGVHTVIATSSGTPSGWIIQTDGSNSISGLDVDSVHAINAYGVFDMAEAGGVIADVSIDNLVDRLSRLLDLSVLAAISRQSMSRSCRTYRGPRHTTMAQGKPKDPCLMTGADGPVSSTAQQSDSRPPIAYHRLFGVETHYPRAYNSRYSSAKSAND